MYYYFIWLLLLNNCRDRGILCVNYYSLRHWVACYGINIYALNLHHHHNNDLRLRLLYACACAHHLLHSNPALSFRRNRLWGWNPVQPAMSLFVTHVGGIVKVQTQADRPTEAEEPLMKISIIIKSSGFCVLIFLFPCCCFSDTSNTSSRSLYLHQHFHHHQLLIITYFIVCDYSLREEEEVELSIGCIL